jgi:hypothetical protein
MSCDISTRKLDVLVDGCEIGVESVCANAAEEMRLTSGIYMAYESPKQRARGQQYDITSSAETTRHN